MATAQFGSLQSSEPNCAVLLCSEIEVVFFHRRENSQIALYTLAIVVADVIYDHSSQFLLAGESSAVITLTLQDAPKTFHGAIVNALSHTGHALGHAGLLQFVVEDSVRVLEPTVTMENGVRIRIGLHSLIKCFKDKRIIVTVAHYKGHNTPVVKIQNST